MLTLSIALCALVAVMGGAGFVLYRRFVNSLRRDHRDTWEAIGKPGLVFYGSIQGQRLAHRFIAKREYEAIDDSDFVELCRFYRGYVRAYSCAVVAACTTLALAGLGVGVV